MELGIERLKEATEGLLELALGGTAVGTGVNTHPRLCPRGDRPARREDGHRRFVEAENHFEAQAAKDAVVERQRRRSRP